jgi:chromosome partitioning protein
LVDADPQANSTTGVGFDLHNVTQSLYDCMVNEAIAKDVVLKTSIPNLDLIPSHIDLVGAEIEMINYPNREGVIKKLLEPIKDDYDFIIIDCSPSLGLITVNALVAADSVVVPVQTEFFALEGLGKLLNTIKIVQNRLNTDLQIEGILMTMYDGRLRLCNQVVAEVRRHFEDMVFSSIIHRNTRLSEAPSFGKPVILYDADSKGAINYLNLAKEVLQKNNLTKINQEDKIIE